MRITAHRVKTGPRAVADNVNAAALRPSQERHSAGGVAMAIGFETGSGWYDRIAEKHHFFGRDGIEPIHCIISHAALTAVACDRSAATPSDFSNGSNIAFSRSQLRNLRQAVVILLATSRSTTKIFRFSRFDPSMLTRHLSEDSRLIG